MESTESKPAIIVDTNPETGEVNIGADINNDGKLDFTFKTIITNKIFWIVLSIVAGVVVITKAANLW